MRLVVVGTGYVGLVTGACFAEMGNQVVCIDIDEAKLENLRQGKVPIHEPGLEDLVTSNAAAGRLIFSNDLSASLADVEVIFIAVGTPPNEDGSANLSHVMSVAETIGQSLTDPLVIATKSTVPVGTTDQVREMVDAQLQERGVDVEYDVLSNPEFLREGSAVKDFMYPDRIIVGTTNAKSQRIMDELYGAFAKKQDRIQYVGIRDAEMIKYAANAMLATKISFMNEVALMCDEFNVDVENVRRGIGSDPRIGGYIYPGCGYGGACFPKDVNAMVHMAEAAGIEDNIFQAVESRNNRQQLVLVDKIRSLLGSDLSGKRFALWGLSFKPETDDIRGAPAITIAKGLCQAGASIVACDPKAAAIAAEALAGMPVEFVDDPYAATEKADALVVVTEWRQFKQPDFRRLSKQLKEKTIFDGRNIYNPDRVADYGLRYVGIGRSNLNQ